MPSYPKERRFESYGGRHGPGVVHRYIWDSLNKIWYVACREVYQSQPHGREVQGKPVTCLKCDPEAAKYDFLED